MKTIKQAAEYAVLQRGDGRYAVRGKDRKWINGDAKVEILVKEGLLKQQAPKPEPATPADEAPAEEAGAAAASGDEAGAESDQES